MLQMVGGLLILLGVAAGAALVAAPFGVLSLASDLTLWILFPTLCVVGFGMFAMQARDGPVRAVSLAASALLLLLAVAAVAGLVLGAASIVPAPTGTASLWFVLVVALVLGGTGAASFGRAP